MTNSHTPGPWKRYGGGKRRWGIAREGFAGSICQMTRTDDEAANARLISAAPDLLAACEAAIDAIEENIDDEGGADKWAADLHAACKAAIAKAKGGVA